MIILVLEVTAFTLEKDNKLIFKNKGGNINVISITNTEIFIF